MWKRKSMLGQIESSVAELCVTGVGIVSSVGFGAAVTTNSIRADISGMQEIPIPGRGRRVLIGAPIVGLAKTEIRERRLELFAKYAAREALEQAAYKTNLDRENCSVFFVLPEVGRPGYRIFSDIVA